MKTYSRELKEQQYDYIAAINPIVKIMLPFDKLLMCDMSEVISIINTASGAKIKDANGKELLTSTQYELIRYSLLETNEYGHSTVLHASRDSIEILHEDDALSTIVNCNEKIVLNIAGEERYIQLWGGNAEVIMFGKKEACKHVSVVDATGNSEFYITIKGGNKVYTAWHSQECKACKVKSCVRKPSRSSIALPSLEGGGLELTPAKPYELTRNRCGAWNTFYKNAIMLGSVIREYEDRKHGNNNSMVKHDRNNNSEVQVKNTGISIVQPKQSSEEVFIKLHNYYPQDGEYKSGHHNSPTVHTVDGYWRRRSKKDSTLIFVESFARGGTKAERDEISKSMKKKQVVYKV